MISSNRKVLQNQKLGKVYKLCSEKEISSLFKVGKKFHKFPFSAHYKIQEEKRNTPFQLVISVPKRNFKKATDRNHLKRLIKEVIRKNKLNLETFLNNEQIQLSFFLVYTHKEKMTYNELSIKAEHFISFLIENIKNEKLS
jgi:ribonuclease P protein component